MLCIFKSKWSIVIFVFTSIGVYFLIPQKMFYGWYYILAYAFIFSTAFTSTCIFHNFKERIIFQRKSGKSFIAVPLSLFGIIATQVCGIGAPVCGVALGGAIGLTFLPTFAQSFFEGYAPYIIIIAILGQFYSVYILKCFGYNYCISSTKQKKENNINYK